MDGPVAPSALSLGRDTEDALAGAFFFRRHDGNVCYLCIEDVLFAHFLMCYLYRPKSEHRNEWRRNMGRKNKRARKFHQKGWKMMLKTKTKKKDSCRSDGKTVS